MGQLKFIDSFQFTPKGLDVLADDEFRYLRESCTSNHFGLIQRKGVYPYDYMDSFDRFTGWVLYQIIWLSLFELGVYTCNSSVDCLWM